MMKKVPKRRFKGFLNAGDWEQRKLGECMNSFAYGLNAAAKGYDGMHKYIRITDIDDETHNFIQSNLASPDIDFNMDVSHYKLNVGDIVFARTGASVGKTYLYNPNDGDLYYAGFLIRGKVKEDCDAGFIYQNTLTKDYDSFIKITSQRSGQPGVNSKEYATFRLNIPCKDEQEKISKVLNSLDELFTLHQRKLEKLQATKKALLYELFPIENSRRPKRRFKGFTGDWEQRKLSEVTTCFDNLRVPVTASDRVPGKIPYYGANGIQDYVSGHTHSGEFVLIAEDGANDLNDYPIQYVNGAIWVNNHAHVIAGYKEKLENKFLSYSLKTVKMSTFIVGGGRSKLNLKALLEIPISMPNHDEQCCIGKFIENIDKNITLHQRKLEKLKNLKAAYLNEMFV